MGRSLIAIKLSVLLFVLVRRWNFLGRVVRQSYLQTADVYGDVKGLHLNSTLCHNWS